MLAPDVCVDDGFAIASLSVAFMHTPAARPAPAPALVSPQPPPPLPPPQL